MLKIENISFRIGGKALFESGTAMIPQGHKVGIVGRNGIGKSTLFNLIRGESQLESGSISVPSKSKIGSMAQEAPATDKNLIETVVEYDKERHNLLEESKRVVDPSRVSEIQLRLADIESHTAEPRASSILKGLGFNSEAQLRATKTFSGGWRMRVALAGLLFSQPDILLLDEPTNFLDLEGVFWLQRFLSKYPHSAIIISHDRDLLNRSVNSILHINNKSLRLYSGNFDIFDKQRRENLRHQAAAAKKQDERIKHMQKYVDRFRYQATKAKQAQSRLKMIEKMEPIAIEDASRIVRFTFPEPEDLSPPLITLENVTVGYNGNAILSKLNLRLDQDDRIALIGANGEGKSTFAKLISKQLVAMAGEMRSQSKIRIGYFAQHQIEDLSPNETSLEHLKPHFPNDPPSKLRSRLSGFGIDSEIADNTVNTLSGGQKARLSLLLATIHSPHILILDEPTNHLDMESREALIRALANYSGAVIIISHDLHLLSLTANKLWLINKGKLEEYPNDLNHYREFLLNQRGNLHPQQTNIKPKKHIVKKNQKNLKYQSEIDRSEKRIEQIEEMLLQIDDHLSNPLIYEQHNKDRLEKLQKKRLEIKNALKKAELLWDKAILDHQNFKNSK